MPAGDHLAIEPQVARPRIGGARGVGRAHREADNPRGAPLVRKVTSSLGLTEIIPVRLVDGKAEPIASGYWPLAPLAGSDGWFFVLADSEGYPAGAEVMVRPWP